MAPAPDYRYTQRSHLFLYDATLYANPE